MDDGKWKAGQSEVDGWTGECWVDEWKNRRMDEVGRQRIQLPNGQRIPGVV